MIKVKELNFFLIASIIVGFNFFNHNTLFQYQEVLLVIICLIIVAVTLGNVKYISATRNPYIFIIILLMTIPNLSGFSKMLYWDSSFFQFNVIIKSCLFCYFFVLLSKNTKEESIISSIIVVGLFLFSIQLFQLFFPGYASFGLFDEERSIRHNMEVVEVRNGLNRYNVGGVSLILFCMYYSWYLLMQKFSINRFLLFAAFGTSMYLLLTRQILFSSLVTFLLSFFVFKTKKKRSAVIVLFILAVGVVVINFESLFGFFLESARDEANTDNIRYASSLYFGGQIFNSGITAIFGNSLKALDEGLKSFGYDPSDVGIIGQAFYFGISWILLWIYVVYLSLKKHAARLPLYIKLFVLGTTIQSIGIFPYMYPGDMIIWACILYISSRYVYSNKAKIKIGYELQ